MYQLGSTYATLQNAELQKHKAQEEARKMNFALQQEGYEFDKDGNYTIRYGSNAYNQYLKQYATSDAATSAYNGMQEQRFAELESQNRALQDTINQMRSNEAKSGLATTFRDIYSGNLQSAQGLNKYMNSTPYIKENFSNAGIRGFVGVNFNDADHLNAIQQMYPYPEMYDTLEKQRALANTLVFLQTDEGLVPYEIDDLEGMLLGDAVPQKVRDRGIQEIFSQYEQAFGVKKNEPQTAEEVAKNIERGNIQSPQEQPQDAYAQAQQSAEEVGSNTRTTSDIAKSLPGYAQLDIDTARLVSDIIDGKYNPMKDASDKIELEKAAYTRNLQEYADRSAEEAAKAKVAEDNRRERVREAQKDRELDISEQQLAEQRRHNVVSEGQTATANYVDARYKEELLQLDREKNTMKLSSSGQGVSTDIFSNPDEYRKWAINELSANPEFQIDLLSALKSDKIIDEETGKVRLKTKEEKREGERLFRQHRLMQESYLSELAKKHGGKGTDILGLVDIPILSDLNPADYQGSLRKYADKLSKLSKSAGSATTQMKNKILNYFGETAFTDEEIKNMSEIAAQSMIVLHELLGSAMTDTELNIGRNNIALLIGPLMKAAPEHFQTVRNLFVNHRNKIVKTIGHQDAEIFMPSYAYVNRLIRELDRAYKDLGGSK